MRLVDARGRTLPDGGREIVLLGSRARHAADRHREASRGRLADVRPADGDSSTPASTRAGGSRWAWNRPSARGWISAASNWHRTTCSARPTIITATRGSTAVRSGSRRCSSAGPRVFTTPREPASSGWAGRTTRRSGSVFPRWRWASRPGPTGCAARRRSGNVRRRKPEQISAYAAMTRMSIEQICLDTIRGVERSVGARGLMRPAPFARLIRHLTMYLRQPAPDAVMERIGRYALNDPRPCPRALALPAARGQNLLKCHPTCTRSRDAKAIGPHAPRSSMRRFTQFLVHYCGLAAAVCVLATCLALCTLDPMPRYPHYWNFGPGGPHPTLAAHYGPVR